MLLLSNNFDKSLEVSLSMNGIVNWNVLTNIFGNDFNFTDASIEYIRSEPLGGSVYIDFVVNSKVVNPPTRWKYWDKIYVKIDFAFVKKLYWQMESKEFNIRMFSIQQHQQAFGIEIRDSNFNVIEFNFEAARVQNVKPLIYNEKYDRYEAD